MENNLIVKAAPVLNLPSPGSIKLERYAGQRYSNFLQELSQDVPILKELSQEDRETFLLDEEKTRLLERESEIREWLQRCDAGNDIGSLMVYPYSQSLVYSMRNLKEIVKIIANKKSAYLEQEKLKNILRKAIEQLNVPWAEAKEYLTPEEHQLFKEYIIPAAQAYLNGGKGCYSNDWRLDDRATIYLALISRINERKQEAARRREAAIEAQRLQQRRQVAIQNLKNDLAGVKKPEFGYPPELAKYTPHSWCELEQPAGIRQWADPKISEKVPGELKNIVSWDINYEWTALPYCKYTLEGLPCLVWYFKRVVLVKASLRLKDTSEGLGCLYLGPVVWDTPENFISPLMLLLLLASGDVEAPGVQVISRNPPLTTFDIEGFGEEVTLHDNFTAFVKDITTNKPLHQALLSRQLIDAGTVHILETKIHSSFEEGNKVKKVGEPNVADQVVEKLVSMGWTEKDAKKAVKKKHFPPEASGEAIVKFILESAQDYE